MHPTLQRYSYNCFLYKHMQSAYKLLAVSLLPVQTQSECGKVSEWVHACYSTVYIRFLCLIPYPFLMVTHMAVTQLAMSCLGSDTFDLNLRLHHLAVKICQWIKTKKIMGLMSELSHSQIQTMLVNSPAERGGGEPGSKGIKNTFCFPCWNVNGWSDL